MIMLDPISGKRVTLSIKQAGLPRRQSFDADQAGLSFERKSGSLTAQPHLETTWHSRAEPEQHAEGQGNVGRGRNGPATQGLR